MTFKEASEKALLLDSHWTAPLLWRSELRNVLATQMRSRWLSLQDAQNIMNQAEQLLRGNEYSITSHSVLRLSAASGCSAYDCEFIALAEDLGIPLVMVNRQLVEKFLSSTIDLEHFIA